MPAKERVKVNKIQGALIVELMRKVVEVSHHYEGNGKYFVHFRCKDNKNLKYVVDIAASSNNQIMIQSDENGWYYTLVVQHNCDILEHHLTGNRRGNKKIK